MTRIFSYCSVCDRDQNSELISEYKHVTPNEMGATLLYRILRCLGCSNVSLSIKLVDAGRFDVIEGGYVFVMLQGKDVTFPPKLHRRQPKTLGEVSRLDEVLSNLIWEAYSTLNMNCHVLAAVGLRAIFDRASELLGINARHSFAQKLDVLKDGGWIGETERELLAVLVDAGSAAAHRGWRPSIKELDLLFDVLEPFLERAFLTKDAVLAIARNIPPRARR